MLMKNRGLPSQNKLMMKSHNMRNYGDTSVFYHTSASQQFYWSFIIQTTFMVGDYQ